MNLSALRMDMARDTDRHVKKTLPPSLNGLPGEATVHYYVKVTVTRPAFYKENFRSVCGTAFILRCNGSFLWPIAQVLC